MNSNKRNLFKNSLKEKTPIIKDYNFYKSKDYNLLKSLDLLNAPRNIKISISDDSKYINFQLQNEDIKKPLVFQLPIEDVNLDAYHSHPQFEELSNRYELYSTEYKDKIKEYSIQERKYLQEQFPGLIFNLKIRMKSKSSYDKKIDDSIQKNAELFINDIIAERIIISEYNSSRKPEVLNQACYDVAKALYDFRANTDFRMKNIDTSKNIAQTDENYITKDYIAHPKSNNYQSLHITVEDTTNPDCCYETQIRTFDMEESSKKDEAMAHKKYKPRLLNDRSSLKVPKYIEVTNFLDADGMPIVWELSTAESFYHYYGVYIKDYRSQLSQIEQYVSFKEIRQKLKGINLMQFAQIEK